MRKLWLPVALAATGTALAQDAGPAAVAWLMQSTGLVFLMVVGLALFYGGLVRRKNALNTMLMCFAALGTVSLAWAAIGYSLAFGGSGPLLGDLSYALLRNVGLGGEPVPRVLDFGFQGAFAVIAAALISGAVVERMRFSAYALFIALWSVLVYAPLAKWVWGGGFLERLGALDFAGGTVVHISAGVSALVLSLAVGRRADCGSEATAPHQVPFTLLGAGLLWFGWFGFNGGSAYGANQSAALAVVNTLLAPAATLVAWSLLDLWRDGKVTAVGVATAAVVGLVAITPAAGLVGPAAAIAIGLVATFPSYALVLWRPRSRLDDSLDVFAVHGAGGISGALLTGLFASTAWGAATDGGLAQLLIQALAVAAALLYSAAGTWVIAGTLGLLLPLRAQAGQEAAGLDLAVHGEEAYASAGAPGHFRPGDSPAPARPLPEGG